MTFSSKCINTVQWMFQSYWVCIIINVSSNSCIKNCDLETQFWNKYSSRYCALMQFYVKICILSSKIDDNMQNKNNLFSTPFVSHECFKQIADFNFLIGGLLRSWVVAKWCNFLYEYINCKYWFKKATITEMLHFYFLANWETLIL